MATLRGGGACVRVCEKGDALRDGDGDGGGGGEGELGEWKKAQKNKSTIEKDTI